MDTSFTPDHPFTPDLIDQLRAPFPWDAIEVRPGSVRKDGKGALALAYADPRVYMERLDAVVGPEHWNVEFAPWGENKLICRLSIFGIVKCSTGEADPKDKNAGTVAEAQAFKRACVAFGLGRYLYELPQMWARGDGDSRSFRFENPDRVIDEMRRKYELVHPKPPIASRSAPTIAEPSITPTATTSQSATQTKAASHTSPQQATKLATARAALSSAEQRTGYRDPTTR